MRRQAIVPRKTQSLRGWDIEPISVPGKENVFKSAQRPHHENALEESSERNPD